MALRWTASTLTYPSTPERDVVRFALVGLVIAAAIFLVTGGHLLFLPLFFLLPLGGLFGHRRHYRGYRRYH